MKKTLTDFDIICGIKITFFGLFFSNYWPLLSNILAVSQGPEDRHCLKQNTYTSLDLNLVIPNEIWYCHVFGKPKQPKKRLIWFKTQYPSPLSTKINWAYRIFEGWQRRRLVKVPIVKVVGLFKSYNFHEVESLETPLVEMGALSVNYWLTKFV